MKFSNLEESVPVGVWGLFGLHASASTDGLMMIEQLVPTLLISVLLTFIRGSPGLSVNFVNVQIEAVKTTKEYQ